MRKSPKQSDADFEVIEVGEPRNPQEAWEAEFAGFNIWAKITYFVILAVGLALVVALAIGLRRLLG